MAEFGPLHAKGFKKCGYKNNIDTKGFSTRPKEGVLVDNVGISTLDESSKQE